ncbi:hypothetical protein Tco_1540604 [Tanacetum coccineum]
MTSDLSLLKNFVEKFIGIVCFGNDHFAAITGYGDYVHANITIFHVYYVEGLGHNLFSVGQFYDGNLEVAFRSKTCYVRNLEGDDLLTTTSTKSWLWHRRLSHRRLLNLNFCTINNLTKQDLVDGLLKFKYEKDHLCSGCERGKSKKATHPPKLVPNALDSPYLLVLITGTSQSKQHDNATYSTSADDITMQSCFFDIQLTSVSPRNCISPEVLLRTDENEEVEVDNEAELKMHMVIIKDDDIAIDAIPVATKPPMIVEYKLIKEGIIGHYQLIRADGSSKRYSSMIRMLQGIDREDYLEVGQNKAW